MRVEVRSLDEHTLGQLIYFFEKARGISGYLLGVNPSTSPEWRPTRRTCSRSWESPATKASIKILKENSKHTLSPEGKSAQNRQAACTKRGLPGGFPCAQTRKRPEKLL